MKLGLTYDLRSAPLGSACGDDREAEFDLPETIQAIEKALIKLDFETERIGGIRQLTRKLARGDRWDLVFNIAEGSFSFGREAQVPALLDAFGIPYTFSDPLVLTITLHKGMTKRIVRDMGFPTPDFIIVETEADIDDVTLDFPLFVKPVAEGSSMGISADSKVTSTEEIGRSCRSLLRRFGQPVLIEEHMPGREFTVGIVGTGKEATVYGVMEVVFGPNADGSIYSFINKELCEEKIEYRLADDTEAREAGVTALAVWRSLGCRDAGRIDMRSDAANIPHFLEVNPLAGLHPQHSDLPIIAGLKGIRYIELIGTIIVSALQRVQGIPPNRIYSLKGSMR